MAHEGPRDSAILLTIGNLCILATIEAQRTTYTKGSHIVVERPNIRGMPKNIFCGIVMYVWSLGAQTTGATHMRQPASAAARAKKLPGWCPASLHSKLAKMRSAL